MTEYIKCETCLYNKNCQFLAKHRNTIVEGCSAYKNAADMVEVVHGEWILETHSFYVDTWDESIEFVVYITANCSKCDQKHPDGHEVYSKRLYAPEDADENFRFDKEAEELLALKEFRQRKYDFAKYCPNCGAKMDGIREV